MDLAPAGHRARLKADGTTLRAALAVGLLRLGKESLPFRMFRGLGGLHCEERRPLMGGFELRQRRGGEARSVLRA